VEETVREKYNFHAPYLRAEYPSSRLPKTSMSCDECVMIGTFHDHAIAMKGYVS